MLDAISPALSAASEPSSPITTRLGGQAPSPPLSTSTGLVAWCTTPSETLPTMRRSSVPCPRLPTTKRSASTSSARSRIVSTGGPITRWASRTAPPASATTSLSCCKSLPAASSRSPGSMTGWGTYCHACTRCSCAPVLLERSTAAWAASLASSEPSVASRIFFGRWVIFSPSLGCVTAHEGLPRTRLGSSVRGSRDNCARRGWSLELIAETGSPRARTIDHPPGLTGCSPLPPHGPSHQGEAGYALASSASLADRLDVVERHPAPPERLSSSSPPKVVPPSLVDHPVY